MAPSIVTSQLYSNVSVSQMTCALPAASGDGYTLIITTNNGTLPLPPTSPTLIWKIAGSTSFGGYSRSDTLPGGEQGTISVFHASFQCRPGATSDSGSCSGEVVTINFTGTVDAAVVVCLGVTGTGGVFFPVGITIDLGVINGPAYFHGTSQTQPAPLTFSTNDYNDLSVCINISDQGSLSNNVPTGYTSLISGSIFGANKLQVSVGYQSFTTSQNNVSWNWGVISGFGSSAVEFAYSDGTGARDVTKVAQLLNPLRRSKLINHIIGR